MKRLPSEFLAQQAKKYGLSQAQEEAFIACFSRDEHDSKIAQAMHIAGSTFRSRMTGVYTKFRIGGKGPNKRQRLHDWLWEEYQKTGSSKPPVCESKENKLDELDELVQQVREAIQPFVYTRCDSIRVLDMSQPLSVGTVYISVNILEKITGRRRLKLAELLQNVSREDFDRFSLGAVREERFPVLEAVEKYSKLIILGKPGAGKTTCLKYLAIQCVEGVFQPHCVPLFISIKDFAETEGQPSLLQYINSLISPSAEIDDHSSFPIKTPIEEILDNGRTLILLDGLDEVRETDVKRVLRQIQQFSERYFRNTFVITCRIAASEYTLEQFTEVEIADFDNEQIVAFVDRWFGRKQQDRKTDQFLEKLKYTPWIRELATCPLLLTLLCLVFEDSGRFPTQRWKLYRDGLKALLKLRSLVASTLQEPFYKALSPAGREALFRQIALPTFEKGAFFFDLDALEKLIKQVLPNCLNSKNDVPEIEDLDIDAFLAVIESQHGILVERAHEVYSFSHLAFHEYFASRQIVETVHLQSLAILASHFTEPRWYEVMLLALEMLEPADNFLRLMQQQTNRLLAGDEKLERFLTWVSKKASSVNTPYRPVTIRAVYFEIAFNFSLGFDSDLSDILYLACLFDYSFGIDYCSDSNLGLDLNLDLRIAAILNFDLESEFNLNSILNKVSVYINDPKLQYKLQQVKDQIPDMSPGNWENFCQWWQANGKDWTEQFRTLVIQHRNIGHIWQFSNVQKKQLKQYYRANKLLAMCLNKKNVSDRLRQEVEENLLLPPSEIVQRYPPDNLT